MWSYPAGQLHIDFLCGVAPVGQLRMEGISAFYTGIGTKFKLLIICLLSDRIGFKTIVAHKQITGFALHNGNLIRVNMTMSALKMRRMDWISTRDNSKSSDGK